MSCLLFQTINEREKKTMYNTGTSSKDDFMVLFMLWFVVFCVLGTQTVEKLSPQQQPVVVVAKAEAIDTVRLAAPVEPNSIEFYTGNWAFAGATVEIINFRGDREDATFAESFTPRNSESYRIHMRAPEELKKGFTVIVRYRNGKYSVFKQPEVATFDRSELSIYAVITQCVPGGIPRLYANGPESGWLWPLSYKGSKPRNC